MKLEVEEGYVNVRYYGEKEMNEMKLDDFIFGLKQSIANKDLSN